MNNQRLISLFDGIVIVNSGVAFWALWLSVPMIDTLLRPSGNFTQTSVTTQMPGIPIEYFLAAPLVAGIIYNGKRKRLKMTVVSALGLSALVIARVLSAKMV